VLLQKAQALGDPKLLALSVVAERLAASVQPLVPERLFVLGEGQGQGVSGNSVLGQLAALLLAEKAGIAAGPTTTIEPVRPAA
jgi:hypothetical protein